MNIPDEKLCKIIRTKKEKLLEFFDLTALMMAELQKGNTQNIENLIEKREEIIRSINRLDKNILFELNKYGYSGLSELQKSSCEQISAESSDKINNLIDSIKAILTNINENNQKLNALLVEQNNKEKSKLLNINRLKKVSSYVNQNSQSGIFFDQYK